MNRLVVLLCFVLVSMISLAGPLPQNPPGDIPPFKLMRTNGAFFKAAELPKGKPVMLVYFAPDCNHCHTLLNDIFKNFKAFNHLTVVLATFKPVDELRIFERQYNTAAYKNIITGTEGTTFFLRYHYNIPTTPYTVLFDKNGKQVTTFKNEKIISDLLKQVKLLQK